MWISSAVAASAFWLFLVVVPIVQALSQ